MSRTELERFVADAETNPELRETLQLCRNQAELILAARTRGYHITRMDLLRAWQEHSGAPFQKASGS